MYKKQEIANQLNQLGKSGEPFGFLIDFLCEKPVIFSLNNPPANLFWEIPESARKLKTKSQDKLEYWKIFPFPLEYYFPRFEKVMWHIHNGDTYLLNFTQPTKIETNLTLSDIFNLSSAPYKIYSEDQFVCFSPECFVKIENGRIFSFPMKGTIDADIEESDQIILNDSKELAEHHTIVDLIRNDLSLVADDVRVDKFRFLSHIRTNNKNLWQVSSQISGRLPENWNKKIGDIIFKLLPAGSISGAPKKKTLEIIADTENYNRGYYTGIFGIFDGKNLDSCVLIRFIENQDGQLVYKSGGGITHLSDAKKEYDEMLKKVYVPIA